MPIKAFRANIDEYAAFNAYKGFPPFPPRPIPVTGENVSGWTVDSGGVNFNYKIIHNLNLTDPGKLIVQLKNIKSSINPVYARVFPGTANYFVVQGYGLRPGGTGPRAEFEHSCAFTFEAELFS